MVELMNRFLSFWVGVWTLTGLVQAQVEFKLTVPQAQFLPGERIEAVARFSNFTGRPLTLGKDAGWLQFQVEDRSGRVVNKISEVDDSGSFDLKPLERGILRFNLTPHFQLDQPGRFRVVAMARLSAGEEVTSSAATFELVRGNRVAEQSFGYNGPDGAERRKFILHQVNYLKEVTLYVRCTDELEATTYNITRLGTTVSFTRPQESLDADGRWHVLHQFGRTTYHHHVFGPDGLIQTRHTYVINDRRPTLRVNEAGKIAVIGGERRPSADDIPAANAALIVEPAPFIPDDTIKTNAPGAAIKR